MLHDIGHLLSDLAAFPNMDPSESLASRRRLYTSLAWVASALAYKAGRAASLVDQPRPRAKAVMTDMDAHVEEGGNR